MSLNVPTVAVVDRTEKGSGACGVPVTVCLVFGVFNHEFPSEVLCPSPQAMSRRQLTEKGSFIAKIRVELAFSTWRTTCGRRIPEVAMFRTCSTVTLSARLLWCKWLEALGTHQVRQQSNCGCCTWTENHEQYASCSARSTKVSLKSAWFVVTGSLPLLNEQQLVYWTQSFGVYWLVFRYAFAVHGVKVAAVNDPVMPFGYTVYNSYERVHERFNGTIGITERMAKNSSLSMATAPRSSTRRIQLPLAGNHWFLLRLRVKRIKTGWNRQSGATSLVYDQLLGTVDRRDVVLPHEPTACVSWGVDKN